MISPGARPCAREPRATGLGAPVNTIDGMSDSAADPASPDSGGFVQSLMDTDLYSIGAYFCDQNPDLVDEVVMRGGEIEREGLSVWAAREQIDIEEAFGMLLTGLAVRYYKAVTG
jgi:hypothetical protein